MFFVSWLHSYTVDRSRVPRITVRPFLSRRLASLKQHFGTPFRTPSDTMAWMTDWAAIVAVAGVLQSV